MLELFKLAFTYKLNPGALEDLRLQGVPGAVVQQLTCLSDSRFSSRHELAAALPGTIGPADAQRYEGQIIRAAHVLRVKRVFRIIGNVWDTNVARSRLQLPWSSYVALRPLVFTLRFRARWWRFALQRRLTTASQGAVRENANANANVAGFDHNRKQVLSLLEGHRNRTESIINVLRTIQGYDFKNARTLCVGPRNEAEMLLLDLYGFPLRNMKGIDLFSYSPIIDLMDMNDLRFPDDRFDVYYSSAVIKYSPDIRRTVSEAIRVTRDGGLMVFGFMFGGHSDLIPPGAALDGGLRELLGFFGNHVGHVYWQEEFPYAPGDTRASIIFRLRK